MENNEIGNRIRELRHHYKIGVKDFAALADLSHVAVFQMESGRTGKPQRRSLHRMARVFGTTVEWLLYGEGVMLPNGTQVLSTKENDHWKEEAWAELKARNELLEREVERLWMLVQRQGFNPPVRMVGNG